MIRLLSWVLIAGAFCSWSVGCTKAKQLPKSAGQVAENLRTIAAAYDAATQKSNVPPKGPEDIKPFLPPGPDQDKLFTSARDNQPFVIIWGTDPRTGMDVKPLVIGYEKQGVNGARMVYTAMGVMMMSNESFADAKFPPGHKP